MHISTMNKRQKVRNKRFFTKKGRRKPLQVVLHHKQASEGAEWTFFYENRPSQAITALIGHADGSMLDFRLVENVILLNFAPNGPLLDQRKWFSLFSGAVIETGMGLLSTFFKICKNLSVVSCSFAGEKKFQVYSLINVNDFRCFQGQ